MPSLIRSRFTILSVAALAALLTFGLVALVDPPAASPGRAPTPSPADRPSSHPVPHRSHARGTLMPSLIRSRFTLLSVAALAALLTFGLVALVDPPAADAQKKKILNVAAKEPETQVS